MKYLCLNLLSRFAFVRNYYLFILLITTIACKIDNSPLKYADAVAACTPKVENNTIYINYNCLDGVLMPEFNIADMNNSIISNDKIKGKIILLHFWFIECPPCIKEIPSLAKINEMFKGENFEIISICRNSKSDLEEFLKGQPISYQIAADGREIIEKVFQWPFGYPSNILIDENGKIVNVYKALNEGNKNSDYEKFINEVMNRL